MKKGTKFKIKLADLIDVPNAPMDGETREDFEARKLEADRQKADLGDREIEVAWQGKGKALKWGRQAQRMNLENHRELHALLEEYPADVAPELHERDDEGNLKVEAPGALERQHELAMTVLEPSIGEEMAEELFDEDPILCFRLALEVMDRHRLDAKVPLS